MGGTHILLIVALFFTGATKVNGSSNQGRLLTPEEGCGFQAPNHIFLMEYQTSWPWMGSLLAYSFLKMMDTKCTATLITSRHALTSADCTSEFDYARLFIRLGETPKNDLNLFSDHAVARSVVHPNFKATEIKNNIAILFLEHDVEFSDRIRPACLSAKASIFSERITPIYRLVRENSFDVSKAAVYLPKNYTQVQNKLCQLLHSDRHWVKPLDQTTFCAQGDYKSGNAGDPFVVKVFGKSKAHTPVYQVGFDTINSSYEPGIFLHLYPYVQWIKSTLLEKN